MGEVWRARDTTLHRDVAIKVLPEAVAARQERLLRFRREAQLLAALNHPNIASIYGFEEAHGVPALVLELVDGPTLADRIAAGRLAVGEALPIAKQIAEAIEAAHANGIIHRDLKPANIKVRRDGTVKVLDFGLAKALDPSLVPVPADGATVTSPAMTVAGVILGTAAYMSPEQARGELADERADVWAFGCVLYEMLTGERVFDGRTVPDVLAAVLTAQPQWNRLPPGLHPRIRLLLERCLERETRDRYHSIADARVDLQKAIAAPVVADAIAPARLSRIPRAALPGAVVIAAIAGALAAWVIKPSPVAPVTRLSHILGADQSFTQAARSVVTMSPDGASIVYVANNQLFLRRLDSLDAVAIRGTEGVPSTPVFSPDGRSIAFWDFKRAQLQRIATDGGTPVRLASVNAIYGASWAEEDVIWYAEENGIWKVAADGGAPEHVVKIEPGQRAHGPQVLPDGRSLLFTLLSRAQGVGSAAWDDAEIVIQSLDTGERRSLAMGSDAQYVPTGHLVFAVDTVLFALPFDVSARTVRGRPVPLVEGVQRAVRTPGSSASANYAISTTGALVYVPASADARALPRSLVAVDRQGRSEPLLDEQRGYWRPRVSPDGTRIAVEMSDGPTEQIWIADLAKRAASPLAAEGTLNVFAAWAPDSRSIVFRSNRDGTHGIYRQQADGTGNATLVVRTPDEPIPTDISRDGVILFAQGSQSGVRAIRIVQQNQVADFLATPAMEHMAVFSPDGKWVAYVSNESGRDEVYVRPFPKVEGVARRISNDGATAPVWARDGSELYFRSAAGDLVAVPVAYAPAFTIGRPQSLFRVTNRFRTSGNAAAYDMHPDGRRFVMVTEPATPTSGPRQINVVQNWFEELRAKVR